MRPAAVLFDCDGVIVDSEKITLRLFADSLARHGLPLVPAEIESLFLGGTLASAADEARRRGARLPEDWVEATYEEMFARLAEGTPLIPGIEPLLDALDKAAIPHAVGSNGPHRKMAVTLGQHPALHARLEGRIFSREDVARPKPAPDLYLHAARALGADPARCAVIEDSPSGVRAALAAGMCCYGFAAGTDGNRLAAIGAIPFRAMADLQDLLCL
ncbi:HAD family phosphatase [Frigidibacter sp. RF13]|uniref:HAD family hydrolase n=1 Tax=Frigidibacter sp. RF13 TaxID=2997340 RepID=UPI00226F33C0|nr:HAD family phosphatase [Frigidibacter sp. RF13]MCY1126706.1 HAD family phosphatase [Frigidibacter sp. RF13]